MSDTASKMPARIWCDEVDAALCAVPSQRKRGTAYYRADIFERLAKALKECQLALAALTAPEAIKTTTIAVAWANCVAAEAEARSALKSYREASNDE